MEQSKYVYPRSHSSALGKAFDTEEEGLDIGNGDTVNNTTQSASDDSNTSGTGSGGSRTRIISTEDSPSTGREITETIEEASQEIMETETSEGSGNEVSFFQQYKWYLIGGGGALGLLFLIMMLKR